MIICWVTEEQYVYTEYVVCLQSALIKPNVCRQYTTKALSSFRLKNVGKNQLVFFGSAWDSLELVLLSGPAV
jgi:hypothetical protein